MVYQRSKAAVFSFLFKRFEMAFGFGLILLVAVSEGWLTYWPALIIFLVALALRLPTVIKELNQLRNTIIDLDDTQLTVTILGEKTVYNLDDFQVLLYKKRSKKISVFVVMSADAGVKFEYYAQMNELFSKLSETVKMRKEVPWWQRL